MRARKLNKVSWKEASTALIYKDSGDFALSLSNFCNERKRAWLQSLVREELLHLALF